MSLKDCYIYQYVPEDGDIWNEDGLIWSSNYFFYNKLKKRVCYLYLRGVSTLGHWGLQLQREKMVGGEVHGVGRYHNELSEEESSWDIADYGDHEGWVENMEF